MEIIVIEMTILPSPPKWIIALKSSSSTMIICENKLQWSLSRYASQWQDCKRVFQFSFTANTFRLWISRHDHNNNRGLNREQRSRRSCPLSNALCIKHCRRKQERGIPFEAVDKVYIRVIGASNVALSQKRSLPVIDGGREESARIGSFDIFFFFCLVGKEGMIRL